MSTETNSPLERKVQELTLLYEISQLLVATPDATGALGSVLAILNHRMGMKRGTITILDPLTQDLRIVASHGLTEEETRRGCYRVGEGITGRVVESGIPIIVPQVEKEPLFLNRTKARKPLRREDISFICVPIKVGSSSYGALSADRLFSEEISFEEDVRLLSIIASIVAQAIRIRLMMEDEKKYLRAENLSLRRRLKEHYSSYNIVGRSNKMTEVFEMIEQVSASNATVLIRGESGTGKELVANAIHYNSQRANGPFVKVNCAALPETLIESELFGHERGAFTGAGQGRIGKFERADKGTIFLDEIGTMNFSAQAKLLRVLQERELERVGGTRTIPIDVRVIAATNKNLEEGVSTGSFREDLYYRLNIFPIYMPPLRERKTDALLLADAFLHKYCKQYGKSIERISSAATSVLMSHNWPGNVRELENCMERAVILCREEIIDVRHLPSTLIPDSKSSPRFQGNLERTMEQFEKDLILEALCEHGGNMAQAAMSLGTTERIVGLRVKKYSIDLKSYRGSQ